MRTVAVGGTEFLINGEPFHFRGFGKHENAPIRGKGHDDALMVHDFELIDWIDADSFRTSHYPYAEEVSDYADRHGIVVIDETAAVGLNLRVLTTYGRTDLPPTYSEQTVGSATQRTHLQVIRELVERYRNHPSVVLWCIADEPDVSGQAARDYFAPLSAQARKLDPGRPVGYGNMIADRAETCTLTDLADVVMVNRYYGWYAHNGDLARAETALEADLRAWADRNGKPIIVTEYGADAVAGLHAVVDTP